MIFCCLQAYGEYTEEFGLDSETYKLGERFHLKTTFDGAKKYFHDYVQQQYTVHSIQYTVYSIQYTVYSC